MTLRLTNYVFGAVAALTWITCGGQSSADDGSYIVSSQVVSDTAVASSTYVGDLESVSVGGDCADGNCGQTCSNGRCGLGGRGGDGAGYQPRKYDRPDLFYNYYSQGNYNSANAQMYLSPMPVPHFVGHTFNTYQPLYPHEFMYWHKDRYHNSYDNGRGMNRTRVKYYAPPIRTAAKNFYWNKLRLPR